MSLVVVPIKAVMQNFGLYLPLTFTYMTDLKKIQFNRTLTI